MLPPDIIEVVKKALQKQREKSSCRIAESDRKRLSRDREQFFRDLISAAGIGRTWFEERAAAFGLPEPVGKKCSRGIPADPVPEKHGGNLRK